MYCLRVRSYVANININIPSSAGIIEKVFFGILAVIYVNKQVSEID